MRRGEAEIATEMLLAQFRTYQQAPPARTMTVTTGRNGWRGYKINVALRDEGTGEETPWEITDVDSLMECFHALRKTLPNG